MRGIVLAVLLVAAGLAGCVGADPASSPASTAPPEQPAAAAPASTDGSSSGPVAVRLKDCRQLAAEIPFPEDFAPDWPGFEREPYEGDPSGRTMQVDGLARECTLVGSGEVVRELWAFGRVQPPERYQGEGVDRYYAAIGGVTTSQRLADAYGHWGFTSVAHGNVSFSLEEGQAAETGRARGEIQGQGVAVNTTVAAGTETWSTLTARVFGFHEGEVTGAVDLTLGEREVGGPGNALIRLDSSSPQPSVFTGRAFHARGFDVSVADVPGIPSIRAKVATPSQSWLQIGNDAGRTGAMGFEGPRTNDTAFQVTLPGTPIIQPIIVGREVYVGTAESRYSPNTTENAVWRIDLATAETTKVIDLGNDVPWRIRPNLVVVQRGQELVAVEVPSGEERWHVKPLRDSSHPSRNYRPTATVDGTLYVPFLMNSQAGETITGGVSAVDLESGEVRWTWTRSPLSEEGIQNPLGYRGSASERQVDDVRVSASEDGIYPYIQLERRSGGYECGVGACTGADADRVQYELWALDTAGEFLWKRNDTDRQSVGVDTPATEYREVTQGPLDEKWGTFTGGKPVVTSRSVHIRLDAFERLNPATGQVLWNSPTGRSDQLKSQGAYGMGVRGDDLIALSPQSVTRLDATTGSIAWQRMNPSKDRIFTAVPVTVGPDTAYVPFAPVDNRGDIGLDAVDLETGDVRWTWQPTYEDNSGISIPSYPAYGPGFVVWGGKDGTVFVVGETDASLGEPQVEPSTTYPDPGEEVTVTLSNTSPGAFGNATRYMVDWGDGTVTGWQEDPTFTHTYNSTGDVEARFIVGNDANQTASTFTTFHVGEEPPQEPTFLQTAFSQKYQDATFGVLGLFVAMVGAVYGAAKRYRKRNLLQEELHALEEGFEDTRHRPAESEAFLDERKAHARSLVLDGVLSEEQLAIVQDRAEELRRELRATAVTKEFAFLPYGLVRKAQEMLEDGRVTSLEAEAFLAALDEVDVLTDTQRAAVRERIEEWFARDIGGKTP